MSKKAKNKPNLFFLKKLSDFRGVFLLAFLRAIPPFLVIRNNTAGGEGNREGKR